MGGPEKNRVVSMLETSAVTKIGLDRLVAALEEPGVGISLFRLYVFVPPLHPSYRSPHHISILCAEMLCCCLGILKRSNLPQPPDV